jgi:hypothetical protein
MPSNRTAADRAAERAFIETCSVKSSGSRAERGVLVAAASASYREVAKQ